MWLHYNFTTYYYKHWYCDTVADVKQSHTSWYEFRVKLITDTSTKTPLVGFDNFWVCSLQPAGWLLDRILLSTASIDIIACWETWWCCFCFFTAHSTGASVLWHFSFHGFLHQRNPRKRWETNKNRNLATHVRFSELWNDELWKPKKPTETY